MFVQKYYDLNEQLGTGSFAQVYQGIAKNTGQNVAVKAIEKKLIDAKQKEYIRIEIAVMKLVHHPHVVALERVSEIR